jgi:hypothetical protein
LIWLQPRALRKEPKSNPKNSPQFCRLIAFIGAQSFHSTN